MKTTKIFIVIAILAFASMSYAKVDNLPHPIKISLRKACEHRGIVMAIYQQIDPRTFLQNDQHGYYCATVYYHRITYIIYGKYEEWVDFFLRDPIDDQLDTSGIKHRALKPIK